MNKKIWTKPTIQVISLNAAQGGGPNSRKDATRTRS
jgi:hypothetical protein